MAEKVKYLFNGQAYTIKGRLCHDIVKYYVEQNPNATLAALQKVFNIGSRMIVATPEMALTVVNSDGKAGGDFYMKEADLIAIKDGKVVVWSYWPESYFKPFMKQVRALGIVVVEQGVIQEAGGNTEEPTAELHPVDTPMLPHEEAPNEADNKTESNELALQLEDLIEAALADGVLTEKEKQILFKKAQTMGFDLDEFEMLLESRLYKKQNGSVIQPTSSNVTTGVDVEKVKSLVHEYCRRHDEILFKKESWDYENVERNSKSGKTIITSQLRKVKVIVTDTERTILARKNYILSLNPQTKEEVLATVEFLSRFMSITKYTESHIHFNAILQKCGNVIFSAKRQFSADQVFMNELCATSKPFRDVISVVDGSIPAIKKEIESDYKERRRLVVKRVLLFSTQILLLCAPWLLLLVIGWEFFWVPIIIDIVLFIMGWLNDHEFFWIDGLEPPSKRDIENVEDGINNDKYWLEKMETASKLLHNMEFPKEE